MKLVAKFLNEGYQIIENESYEINNTDNANIIHLVKLENINGKEYIIEKIICGEEILYELTHKLSDIYKFYKIFKMFKYQVLKDVSEVSGTISKGILAGAFSEYSFKRQTIKCSGCIDSNGSLKDHKCNYCVRNNFAICGDGKIDFYSATEEEREKITKEFDEAKKEKYQKKIS